MLGQYELVHHPGTPLQIWACTGNASQAARPLPVGGLGGALPQGIAKGFGRQLFEVDRLGGYAQAVEPVRPERWSASTGTGTAGTPARRTAPVVPAPA